MVADWPGGQFTVGEGSVVASSAKLSVTKEDECYQVNHEPAPVAIGEQARIGHNVVIHEGTTIGRDCFLDDGTRIGYRCSIGDQVRLEYGAIVCDRVTIGDRSVVAGFVCDAVVIGKHSIVMGQFVHEMSRPSGPWGIEEAAPSVGNGVVIGMGAVVVGGIHIGDDSYVAAGATVTKDVPPGHIVLDTNRMIHRHQWAGSRLEDLP